MGERRAPGVEDGGQTDTCAQMLGIEGDCGQRLGGGGEPERTYADRSISA